MNFYLFNLKLIFFNGDWGLGTGPNPQSPIPNPQSPIPIWVYLKAFKKLSFI